MVDFLYQLSLLFFQKQNSAGMPALVNCGPSGSGKSSLCYFVLRGLKLPHVMFDCSEYTNAKLLYVSLWLAIKECLGKIRSPKQSSVFEDLSKGRSVGKFPDFCIAIGRLISFLFDNDNEGETYGDKETDKFSRQCNPLNDHMTCYFHMDKRNLLVNQQQLKGRCFYIVLDGLDHISRFDTTLVNNLLTLSKVGDFLYYLIHLY